MRAVSDSCHFSEASRLGCAPRLTSKAGDTEREPFPRRDNEKMTAPSLPDMERSHGAFPRAPTNTAVNWTVVRTPPLGHMVFVVVVRPSGLYERQARIPATACLKEESSSRALSDLDHRHLCWTEFEAVVGQELQRQPLNGLIWLNETLMRSELCWQAQVLEMQRAGHSEIQFELRIEAAGEFHRMGLPCTHALTLRRPEHTILDGKWEAQARTNQSRLHVEIGVR